MVAAPRGRGGPTTNQRDQNGPKESVEHMALELELAMRAHARTDSQSSTARLSSTRDCGENTGVGVRNVWMWIWVINVRMRVPVGDKSLGG